MSIPENKLHHQISTFSLFLTTLCGMIGVGWMFGSYHGATLAGPYALWSWIGSGCFLAIMALLFIEMSVAIPVVGSYVRYPHITHGPLASFVMSWSPWLSCVLAAPTEASATIQYAQYFIPGLMTGDQRSLLGSLAAILLLLMFTLLNLLGIRFLMRYSQWLTSWKLAIPVITLVVLLMHTQHSPIPQTLEIPWHGMFEFASGMCIFSFLGFLESTTFVGEVRNPQKTLPRAILGAIAVCTLLYALMQWIFLKTAPTSWYALSPTHQAGPFAALAMHLGYQQLAKLIYIDAMISPTGTGMFYTASTARMVMAMSQNHQLPKKFMRLNMYGVPAWALLFNWVVGLILLAGLSNLDALIKFQSATMLLAYAMGPCSFLALRKRLPLLHRPFRVRCAKLLSWFVFWGCNMLLYTLGWQINALLFGVLGLGGMMYGHHQGIHPQHILWMMAHAVFMLLLPALPGSAWIWLALESSMILFWSVQSARTAQEIQSEIELILEGN